MKALLKRIFNEKVLYVLSIVITVIWRSALFMSIGVILFHVKEFILS